MDNVKLVHGECATERQKAWQQANPNTLISVGEFCKLPIPGNDTVEHMWVKVTDIVGEQMFKGTLFNQPVIIDTCDWGDMIEFGYEDIEDVYIDDEL